MDIMNPRVNIIMYVKYVFSLNIFREFYLSYIEVKSDFKSLL